MRGCGRTPFWLGSLLVVLATDPLQLQAAALPSAFIVQTWVKSHGSHFGPLEIQRKASVVVGGGQKNQLNPEWRWVERTFLHHENPPRLTQVVMNDEGQVLFSQTQLLQQSAVSEKLLFSKNFLDLARSLRSQGIPVLLESDFAEAQAHEGIRKAERVSLQRVQGVFASCLNQSETPEAQAATGASQLCFEKASFQPVKWVVQAPGQVRTEWRWTDFEDFAGFPYPKTASLLKNGGAEEWEVRFSLVSVKHHEKLDPHPHGSSGKGFTPLSNSLPAGFKEAISLVYEH